MNNVQLLGCLVRDPEIRSTKTGKTVANFTIATNEKYKAGDETKETTAYVGCVAWGTVGSRIEGMKKGDRVFANGRIATRSYEQNGQKRYVTEVICDFVAGQEKATSEEPPTSNFNRFADEEVPF